MVYELTWFRCKEGIITSELKEALNEAYSTFWKKQPGFIKSFLLVKDKDTYLHAMCWETAEFVEQCQERIAEFRSHLTFFEIVEPSSVESSIYQVCTEWNNAMEL